MRSALIKLPVFFFASPFGWAATVSGAGSLTGAEVYAQSCAMCHTTGMGGAPSPDAIRELHGKKPSGRAELLLGVLRGKGAMPAKGGNASLTTLEASAALDYMLTTPRARGDGRQR